MKPRPLWIQTVVFRVCVFLFMFSLIAFGLFLLGNLQEFLDSTQIMLIRIAGVSAFFFIVCGLYFLGIAVVLAVRGQRVGWYRVLLVVIGIALSTAIVLFSNFLQSWIEQVR